MKKPIGIQMLYAASLLAFAITGTAHAELKSMKQQAIVEDAITPEDSGDEEVVVIKKKKKAPRVVRQVEEADVAVENDNANSNTNIAIAQAPVVEKPSMGSQLDAGIKTKMGDVQTQFENALLKTLDRIKITVDDGVPAQGASAPTQSVVVQDNFVAQQGAANKADYMSVAAAPGSDDDEFDAGEIATDGSSVATLEKKSEKKIRFAPVFGKTMINSSNYNVDSRYTAGFELEMDLDSNFAMVLGYSYSQYDIGLSNSSSFYNYYQPYGFNGSNLRTLEYNQNLFTGVGRLYLMPSTSKFRVFGGAGVGYNLGYLNYRTNNNNNPYQYYNYNPNVTDYDVKSWLGLLEGGANFNVSENVSLGLIGKYALVFSSSESNRLNNYAFTGPGFNYNQTTEQAVVGGSLAKDSFYSILGTIKVAF